MDDPTAYQIACRMLAQDACEPDHIDAAINEAYQDGWDDAMKKLAAVEREALAEERERCYAIANEFTIDPDACSVHPDIPWKEMNDSAKIASHSTSQQIAAAIRGLKDDT